MNGVLNIFKPKGMSSFDAVRVVKKVAGTGKVGHTGTLDPEATGVLPICIGRATKIIDSINSFKGEYSQIPPMYSALKQNGVRLYELARKGIEVERKGRLINIHNLEDIKINNPYISMKVTCSKGTYIRSLCYDIGEKLGVFATMTQLNRAKTSVFSQEKSININELTKENINDYILSMEEALEKYDKIVVNKKYVKLLVNGVRVADGRFTKDKVINNKLYRVYDDENNFIGLGERNDAGFKIEKLLIT